MALFLLQEWIEWKNKFASDFVAQLARRNLRVAIQE